jgi:hypothetical protein
LLIDPPSKDAQLKLLARGSITPKRSAVTALFPISILWLLTSGSALAVSSEAQIAKSQKRIDQVVAALVQKSDADSLAAAGLMSFGKHSDQALSLLARASAAAPERPDLVWLQAQRCGQSPPCDPEPIEHRLRELDAANGAGWWGTLARASVANDTAGIDTALTAIGYSDRVDIYWTTLVARLSRAVAATKTMSLAESEVAVIGYVAAQSIPAYQSISSSCKAERLQQPGIIEVCRGVANAMQRGDTAMTEMLGVAIAKRVWPEDSPEWKAAAEERRVNDYRAKLYSKVVFRSVTHPGEYLTLCAQNRREQDVLLAQLIALGENPNPTP